MVELRPREHAPVSRRGVAVEAYDPAPPGASENAYHGRCRQWTEVRRGDHNAAVDAALASGASLFVCYPPPAAWKRASLSCFSFHFER